MNFICKESICVIVKSIYLLFAIRRLWQRPVLGGAVLLLCGGAHPCVQPGGAEGLQLRAVHHVSGRGAVGGSHPVPGLHAAGGVGGAGHPGCTRRAAVPALLPAPILLATSGLLTVQIPSPQYQTLHPCISTLSV